MILLDYSGPATRVPANETHYSSQQQRQCASCRHVLQLQAFQTSGISIKTTYRESRLGLSE